MLQNRTKYVILSAGGNSMNIGDKLREARKQLGFSQDYVANCLGINRSVLAQIELCNRKVSTEEALEFCKMYHLSSDYILGITEKEDNQVVFARGFNALTENDQREILNLIKFKNSLNKR